MKLVLTITAVLGLLVFAVLLYWLSLVRVAGAAFDRAMKDAAAVEPVSLEVGEAEGGVAPVRMVGTMGARVSGNLRRGEGDEVRLGVLLLGGIGTGAGAARLAEPRPGMALLAVDYPLKEALPDGGALAKARSVPRIVRGIAESLVGFALARRFLEEEIGAQETAIVGVSLGVPFAAALASIGPKPVAAALLYGGGDVGLVVARALPGPRFLRTIAGRMLGRILAPLDPARLAPAIAPCPLLLVNSATDPRIPEASVRALRDAAREPKKVVRLEGGHVLPEKEELVRALSETTMDWFTDLGLLPTAAKTATPADSVSGNDGRRTEE